MVINGRKRLEQVNDILETMDGRESTLDKVDKEDLNTKTKKTKWNQDGENIGNEDSLKGNSQCEGPEAVMSLESMRNRRPVQPEHMNKERVTGGSRPWRCLEAMTRRMILF